MKKDYLYWLSLALCRRARRRRHRYSRSGGKVLHRIGRGEDGFSMQHTRAQQGSEGFEGEILIKGDKFVLKTPDMFIWFDGKDPMGILSQERGGECHHAGEGRLSIHQSGHLVEQLQKRI